LSRLGGRKIDSGHKRVGAPRRQYGRRELPRGIDTERLFLRAYKAGDGPMCHAAAERNREHLAMYESENALMGIASDDEGEAIVRTFVELWNSGERYFLGVFVRDTGEWAGQVVVEPSDPRVPEYSVGYIADVDHEGRGYISEALQAVLSVLFNELGAHRVKSDCHENNTRSWRLLERCGFTREGHLRENRRNPDGSFHGDYLYGILRGEHTDRTHAPPRTSASSTVTTP
jgi:RimJ/RimL family protein N-acetyltransferase